MNDPKDSSGSSEPSPEPPSRTVARAEEAERQQGEGWFDRLRGALGLVASSPREDIEEALAARDEGGTFTADERTLLQRVLGLRDMRVDEIMVPRSDIHAVDLETTLGELMVMFLECGHSRVPVYRETLDEAIGMIHIRDVLDALTRMAMPVKLVDGNPPVLDARRINLTQTIAESNLVREVLFVPPSMAVATLIATMQTSRTQMALVIDEYGGTDGLVSLEDAVETIVGEIDDEHDDDEAMIVAEGNGVFVADAAAGIDEVAAHVGELASADVAEEVETIGGLVFSLLGRIPKRGERVTAPGGQEIVIVAADPRRIRKLRIKAKRPEPATTAEAPQPRTAAGT